MRTVALQIAFLMLVLNMLGLIDSLIVLQHQLESKVVADISLAMYTGLNCLLGIPLLVLLHLLERQVGKPE